MDRDDEQLVAQVQAGDTAQFGVLYDRYIEPIYRFVYIKTHEKETAEELTGDIFLKAFDRIASYRAGNRGFRAWLYGIARHRVIDYYRRKRSTVSIEDAWDIPAQDGTVQETTDARLQFERLQECMAFLSQNERDILMLRVWEDMTHREIAAVLGKREAAVKKMFSRAVQKLKVIFYERSEIHR